MNSQTDYAVSPGSYLREWLEDEGITQQDLADRLGTSRKTVNQLVRGGNVSPDLAHRLGRVTPIEADVWLRIQAQYDADRERLRQESSLSAGVDRLSKHVKAFLKDCNFVSADGRNRGKLGDEFLTFQGVATWEALDECCLEPLRSDFALAFRTETKQSALDPIALLTWLRACELAPEMDGLHDLSFSEDALRASVPEVRARVAHPDPEMFNDVAQILRRSGVMLTQHDAPARFPLHGVTRWLDDVPVIHQTFRQRGDGFVIFTLFHEIGHVLHDPRGETHLDDVSSSGGKSQSEKKADAFAWDVLFPGDARNRLRSLQSDRDIASAARELGVSPGVIVFDMHRRRLLDHSHGNRLVVRF